MVKYADFLGDLISEGRELEERRVEQINKAFAKYYEQHLATFGSGQSLFAPVLSAVRVCVSLAERTQAHS